MVKCRLCGREIVFRRIESKPESLKENGLYDRRGEFHYGRKHDRMAQVRVYGCSNPYCMSGEMTEREYFQEIEDQRLRDMYSI